METKCPNCETIFRLTDEQLTIAKGKVRCGLCHHVFSAVSADEEPSPPLEYSTPSATTPDNDDFFSDDLLSLNADTTAEETPSESQEQLQNDINHNDFPDEYRDYDKSTTQTQLPTLLWSLGIVFLLSALVTEYVWFNRNKLVQHVELQPWVTQFCDITGCTLDPIHKPELIEMVNRNIYSHPNIKKALMITATMLNTATYAQAYPNVEIVFSNIRGKVVIQRTFSPEEYMKVNQSQLHLLQPDKPVSFGLEIQDPGRQAMTYEFNFL